MTDRPRVLFVSNLYPNPRQPTRGVFNYHTVHSLAPHLELQVMAPVSWYPFSGKLEGIPPSEHDDGIPVLHPRAFYTPGVLRSRHGHFFYRSLAKPVRRLRSSFPFDLLYGSWVYPDGFGVMKLARDFNVPYVLHALGSDINDYLDRADRITRILAALKNASAIICVSKALRDRIAAQGVDPDVLHVVYDGVNTDVFRPQDKQRCRTQLSLPADARIVLFVGSLLPVKGPEYLLESAARLATDSSEPLHVVLVGQGSCLRRLRSLTRRLGLSDCLTFAGPRPHDEIAVWMGAADVLCLPSISEGLPNVVLEALASGRPVVASRVGGLPEIVTDDSRGFLVPPASPEELARALARALEASWDPQALHAAALPFSWAEHGQRIADIVGSVLSQRSS